MMSDAESVSSGDKIVTTSTMMDDPMMLGAHPIFPPAYRPFLDELCEKTKFSKAEIRFLYRGFKQVCYNEQTRTHTHTTYTYTHRFTLIPTQFLLIKTN